MLGALTIPPRLIARALDDLHILATSLRQLADHEGDLSSLVDSVQVLPRVEDELSANVAALRDDIRELNGRLLPELEKLNAQLEPMSAEVRDLNQTAEALEASMASLQTLLKKLPGV